MRTSMMKELSRRATLLYHPKRLLWVIFGFGIVTRLTQYIFNGSLWQDEAARALNIINRSFPELLQPLDYNQGAPIGFLMVEKLLVQLFGNTEYVLRLFPFLCGMISLFLFYKVAKDYIRPQAIPIALGLFAISDKLLFSSSETKQYASDVLIALLLYAIATYIRAKRLTPSSAALFGVIGALAIWFSHPAIFILAGVGVSLALFCLQRREWSRIGGLSVVFSLWLLSFAACYFVSLSNLTRNEVLLNLWRGTFMPFPPMTLSDATWFVDTFLKIFRDPVGLSLPGVGAMAFLIGFISMLSERRKEFSLLVSPILLTLLASGLHKYPFSGRLLLFLVPNLLLLMAEGVEQIRDKTSLDSSIIGLTVIGLLFYHPLSSAIAHIIKPSTLEEIKPVIGYVREHHQEGDLLYLYYGSWPAFEYYSEKYGFKKSTYIIGVSSREDWSNYAEDLNKLRGNKRVWVLFSHVCTWRGVDEEKLFLYHLDNIGTRLDSFKGAGAAVYLYDLKGDIK
jgi:hypothetical protein